MPTVAERVSQFLKESNQSANALAHKIGTPRGFIANLLVSGAVPPRALKGRKYANEDPRYQVLAMAMGVDVEDFCAAVLAEQKRVESGRRPSVQTQAVDSGWSVASVQAELNQVSFATLMRLSADNGEQAEKRALRAAVATIIQTIDASDREFSKLMSLIQQPTDFSTDLSKWPSLFTQDQLGVLPDAINALIATLLILGQEKPLTEPMSIFLRALARLEGLRSVSTIVNVLLHLMKP